LLVDAKKVVIKGLWLKLDSNSNYYFELESYCLAFIKHSKYFVVKKRKIASHAQEQ
jgi:hypothetical protein